MNALDVFCAIHLGFAVALVAFFSYQTGSFDPIFCAIQFFLFQCIAVLIWMVYRIERFLCRNESIKILSGIFSILIVYLILANMSYMLLDTMENDADIHVIYNKYRYVRTMTFIPEILRIG